MRLKIHMVMATLLLYFAAGAMTADSLAVGGGNFKYFKKTYTIFFPVGLSEVKDDYKGNDRTLQAIRDDLDQTLSVGGIAPDSLVIFATTSPEGPAALNRQLAIQRAENTKKTLAKMFPQIKEENIRVACKANDWTAVNLILSQDTTVIFREELLSVINNPKIINKDWYIRNRLPDAYTYFRDNLFGSMRTASVTVSIPRSAVSLDEYVVEPDLFITAESPVEISYEGGDDKIIFSKNVPGTIQETPDVFMAAKTNTLYDLALIPNLGAEFYLGKNFSIAATAVFAWWKNDNIFWYWRTYGADLTLRYWFGRKASEKPLTGHHVGIYGHALTYDFEAGGRGYLADKPSVGYGIEYGYSLPIARRLNLDFNLGFGYFGGEFEEYLPIDGHYVWQVTKHRHWVGPTKVEVSLSWLIGRGNINKDKGGRR